MAFKRSYFAKRVQTVDTVCFFSLCVARNEKAQRLFESDPQNKNRSQMCIDIDLYRYCSVKSQFSSTYVWPNPADALISHTCEHTFPLSYFHIVCRSSKVCIVIKATKAGGKPCRFRGKTLFVGKFSQDVFKKKKVQRLYYATLSMFLGSFDLRQTSEQQTLKRLTSN